MQVACEIAFEEDIEKKEMEVEAMAGDLSPEPEEEGDEFELEVESEGGGSAGNQRRFSTVLSKRVMKGVKGVKSAARRFTISNVGKTPAKRIKDRRSSVVSRLAPVILFQIVLFSLL